MKGPQEPLYLTDPPSRGYAEDVPSTAPAQALESPLAISDRRHLSDQAINILITCTLIHSWHVSAANLLAIAELVRHRYVQLEDDYDATRLWATDHGRDYALNQGWIQSDPEETPKSYSRTPTGWVFASATSLGDSEAQWPPPPTQSYPRPQMILLSTGDVTAGGGWLRTASSEESMFFSMVLDTGIKDAVAFFRNSPWPIPVLSTSLRPIVEELEAMERELGLIKESE